MKLKSQSAFEKGNRLIGSNPGRINISRAGDGLVISWFGNFVLQSAADQAGPFSDIVDAVSPYTNSVSGGLPTEKVVIQKAGK